MPILRRRLAVATALLAAAACGRQDPALGRHVEHPDFPADAAWAFLLDQVAIGPRYAGTRPHDRAARWLRDQLELRADSVAVDSFPHTTAEGKRVTMTNVFARYRPGDARRILLVAHWDTYPKAEESADPYDRTLPVAGANSGASGTALLLAVAEALRQQAPPIGVDILLTDGDDFEAGKLLGTARFLERRPPGYRPAFALVFDRVADRDAWLPQDAASRRHAAAIVAGSGGSRGSCGATPSSRPKPFPTAPERTRSSPPPASPRCGWRTRCSGRATRTGTP